MRDACGTRILITDGEAAVLRLFAQELRGAEFLVRAVSSGEACVDELRLANFDLLVLDLDMPNLDGLTFLNSYGGSIPPSRYLSFPGIFTARC